MALQLLPPHCHFSIRRRCYVSFPLSKLPSASCSGFKSMGDLNSILLGQFMGFRRLPVESMRQYIARNWPIRRLPDVIRREDEVWVFTFHSPEDAQEVYQNGPFEIENTLFGFARPTPENPFPRVDFSRVPTWIEFRNLPLDLMTRSNVEFLASAVGDVIRSEIRVDRSWETAFPRIYLYLNLYNPVLPAIGVGDADDPQQVLISYRIQPLCRRCGKLGHVTGRCRVAQEILIADINAMFARVENMAGQEPITDANHELYSSVHRGSGMLTSWIPFNPNPTLNSPMHGNLRVSRDGPRPSSVQGRPNIHRRRTDEVVFQNGDHMPNGYMEVEQVRQGRNRFSSARLERIPFFHAPSVQDQTQHSQPPLAANQQFEGTGLSPPPGFQPMDIPSPRTMEDTRPAVQREIPHLTLINTEQPTESESTLEIYANDSDLPQHSQVPISSPQFDQSVEAHEQIQSSTQTTSREPLFMGQSAHNLVPVQWIPVPMSHVPLPHAGNWQSTLLQIHLLLQSLILQEPPRQVVEQVRAMQPLISPQINSEHPPTHEIRDVHPIIEQPRSQSPTSVLEPESPHQIEDYMDDQTLAEQLVIMDQFAAQEAHENRPEIQMARSVTSPSVEQDLPLHVLAVQEAALVARNQRMRGNRLFEIGESSAARRPPPLHVPRLRDRGTSHRPGKEIMVEGEASSSVRTTQPLLEWPSVLGIRGREPTAEEEYRSVRGRVEATESSSSEEEHRLSQEQQQHQP